MYFSISRIKLFKACRRAYQLRYVEELLPVKKSEALETGSNYHSLIESLYNGDDDVEVYTKEGAMAYAYKKYIYPRLKVIETEKKLEMKIGLDTFVGIVDGIAEDGNIVEHKTYGGNDSMEAYEYNLQWDEQILAYMLLTGKRKVWYTVCRKPTIRQKKNETDEDFWHRMCEWYDVGTEDKIRLFEITRTEDEVRDFHVELYEMMGEMHNAEKAKMFYKNTCHCNKWGNRCEYSSVCLDYVAGNEYIGYTRKEKQNEENI